METAPTGPDWKALAEDAEARVNQAIAELCILLSTRNRLEVLSRVAIYVLSSSEEEFREKECPEKSETNLEYLCSLATALPELAGAARPSADDIQRTIELATSIHLYATVFYSGSRHTLSEENNALSDLASSFRLQKLYVRGDGYWQHLKQTWSSILAPHESVFQATLGFTSSDFFGFISQAEANLDERVHAEARSHVEPYRSLLRPWINEMGKETNQTISEAFQHFLNANQGPIDAAKAAFDAFGSPDCFTVSASSVSSERLLAMLSCEMGDNTMFYGLTEKFQFWPLNDTLIERRPIIRHQGKHYAFLLPKIGRGAYDLFSLMLREVNPKYWQLKFLPSRDRYLEEETALLLRKALPSAHITTSVTYPISTGGSAEADVVVVIDDLLIIAECKAASITHAAKRGGPMRVKTDVGKTIAHGLSQAERFVGELMANGKLAIQSGDGTSEVMRSESFRWVIRMNVTLDLITSVAASIWSLTDVGLLPSTDRCWSVSLNDLRVVVEILDCPAVFIHYLIRRLDTDQIRLVEASDELDYMMYYIRQGLFFRGKNALRENESLHIGSYTAELDKYYRRLQGMAVKGAKPRITLGSHTQRFLEMLQKWRPKHWMTASIDLLEFDPPDREELLGKLPLHFKRLKKDRAQFAMSLTACSETGSAIALACAEYPEAVVETVKARGIEHCRNRGFAKMCIIIVGIPVAAHSPIVLCLTPNDSIEEQAARILKQLRFDVTMHPPKVGRPGIFDGLRDP